MIKLTNLSTKYNLSKTNKGVVLILTILISVGILAIALGVTSLMVGEIRITREIPWALKAYYAAEVGIERSLYYNRKGTGAVDIGSPPNCTGGGAICLDAGNTVCYSVDVIAAGPNCTADSYCIKSYGCYKRIKRSVEVSY